MLTCTWLCGLNGDYRGSFEARRVARNTIGSSVSTAELKSESLAVISTVVHWLPTVGGISQMRRRIARPPDATSSSCTELTVPRTFARRLHNTRLEGLSASLAENADICSSASVGGFSIGVNRCTLIHPVVRGTNSDARPGVLRIVTSVGSAKQTPSTHSPPAADEPHAPEIIATNAMTNWFFID